MFEGDVLMFNTQDGGEIDFVNGQPEMTVDFRTMMFLCLFGGDLKDDGLEGNKKTWWGNYNENNPDRRYISRFQNLAMTGLPLTSGNLRRFEDAALADLEIFKKEKIATEVTAIASIPARNRLNLAVSVVGSSGETTSVDYSLNWQSYFVD